MCHQESFYWYVLLAELIVVGFPSRSMTCVFQVLDHVFVRYGFHLMA